MHASSGLLALTLLLAAVPRAAADCGDDTADAGAVASARAQADARCDCATAPNHDRYVACVVGTAKDLVRRGLLPRQCRNTVARCAARSTCGRPGATVCCRSDAEGRHRCRIRSAGDGCVAPPGGSACVAAQPSCCGACAGGCGTSPTTTTLPSSTCTSDGQCDDGNGCSQDRCADGACHHECLCLDAGGTARCCPGPAAECPRLQWFFTCGDPVCGWPDRDSRVPPCAAGETAGAACTPAGASCDPGDVCNRQLRCSWNDPTTGGCPISRRRDKRDIRYLGPDDARRLHDELLRHRLATYRYAGDERARHLGFIIDDVPSSPAVDAGGERVDVYAYASMAVVAVQTQAREIARLRAELRALRRELGTRPGP
jgi:hypothetical protein